MTMARYQFTVTDEAGNVIPEAHIEVRRERPGQPLAALKSNRAGTSALTNPFDADSEGFAYFHVSGGAFQIRAYTGPSGAPTFERIWRYVAIGLAAETDAVVSNDFEIKAEVESSDINLGENYLRIAGYAAAGDGGGALYRRVVSEPSHEGKIQSNDGAWWEIAERFPSPAMFGGNVNDTEDYIDQLPSDAPNNGYLGAVGDLIVRGSKSNDRLPIAPSGYLLGSNGTVPEYLPFIQSGTGAATRTWQDKARDFVSILDFGADPTGATSCTAAFNLAIAAGSCIYFPPGVYSFATAPSVLPAKSIRIEGAGKGTTILQTTFATGDFLYAASATGAATHFEISGLSIVSTVTRTSGRTLYLYDITANTFSTATVRDVFIYRPFIGINASGGVVRIVDSDIVGATPNATSAGSAAIVINNINENTLNNLFIYGDISVTPKSAMPTYGIQVVQCGALCVSNTDVILSGASISLVAAGGLNIWAVQIINSFIDTATVGINVTTDTNAASKVRSVRVANTWISNMDQFGVILDKGANSIVSGFEFTGCFFVQVVFYGLIINNAGVTDVKVNGGTFAFCGTGIFVAANVSDYSVIGARFGAYQGFSANTTADMQITAGTSARVKIANNTFNSATKFITAALSGAGNIIKDNIGYNPVGATAAVTMGASPATITAGPSPETHYVRQSATNTATIAKGGQQIATLAGATTYYPIELGPNESYVTTWTTTAPTYTKYVH